MEHNIWNLTQKIQVELLREFDIFCKNNDIKYQLFAGTLLRSIRHKGFIPWDDDIDIAMKRSEYDKFIKQYESNSLYFPQNYQTDINFHRQFTRLRRNNTIYKQKGYDHLDIQIKSV